MRTSLRKSPRLKGFDYAGPYGYNVTVVTRRRQPVFRNASIVEIALEALERACRQHGFTLHAYCFMPDHVHLVWMGVRVDSDQRNAMKFLRKHLAAELARRSPTGAEFELQKQSHDSVLRERDRVRGAFEKSCFYVLDNPRRKGLVEHPRDWPHLGALVPGYPFLHPLGEDFWEQFWKLHAQKREPAPT